MKKAEERFREIDMILDCSERHHEMALYLQSIEEAGKEEQTPSAEIDSVCFCAI